MTIMQMECFVEALMKFERRYRDLEMEYEVLSMKQLLHGLETDRLQMIIVYTAELEKVSGIYCRRLENTAASTGIYCALSHPLVKKKNHTWEDLYGQTIGILLHKKGLSACGPEVFFLTEILQWPQESLAAHGKTRYN